jgi:hypothetical protein
MMRLVKIWTGNTLASAGGARDQIEASLLRCVLFLWSGSMDVLFTVPESVEDAQQAPPEFLVVPKTITTIPESMCSLL